MRAVNWEENIDIWVWSRTGGRMGTVAVDSSEGALGRACGAAASSLDGGHCGLGLMAVAFGIKYGGADGGPRTGVDGRQKGLKEMPLAGALGAAEWEAPGFCSQRRVFMERDGGPKGIMLPSGVRLERAPRGQWPWLELTVPSPRGHPRCPPLTLCLPRPAWHVGQRSFLGQGAVLVQPFPGRPLPKFHRLLSGRAAPRGQLPPAEDHWEGQFCQSQAGPAHPHRPGGEWGMGEAQDRILRFEGTGGPGLALTVLGDLREVPDSLWDRSEHLRFFQNHPRERGEPISDSPEIVGKSLIPGRVGRCF